MSENSGTNLDTLETSGIDRPPESYRKYCITHCADEYQATREAYDQFSLAKGRDFLEPLDQCRTGAWFARNSDTGMVRVLSSSCKLRWCPMCASTRRWWLTQQVSEWLNRKPNAKFLTLTLQHNEFPLDVQIQFLYDSFKKYRKLNLMKRKVQGGVWFFQIHKAKSDNLWHPHLHCVIDSEWIDKYELSTAWEHVTKTSKIINIKEVKDPDSMAEYVARYAARPSILSSLGEDDRFELMSSLHGRRLVGTWGNARTISLRPSKPADSDKWKPVGSFSLIMHLLKDDETARQIWFGFKNSEPIPEDCTLQGLDNELNHVHEWKSESVPEHKQMLLDFY